MAIASPCRQVGGGWKRRCAPPTHNLQATKQGTGELFPTANQTQARKCATSCCKCRRSRPRWRLGLWERQVGGPPGLDMAVGQNQWDPIFGVGAPPILVYFSGDWDVHWGYRILTHIPPPWNLAVWLNRQVGNMSLAGARDEFCWGNYGV